jgi:hypothetical protein
VNIVTGQRYHFTKDIRRWFSQGRGLKDVNLTKEGIRLLLDNKIYQLDAEGNDQLISVLPKPGTDLPDTWKGNKPLSDARRYLMNKGRWVVEYFERPKYTWLNIYDAQTGELKYQLEDAIHIKSNDKSKVLFYQVSKAEVKTFTPDTGKVKDLFQLASRPLKVCFTNEANRILYQLDKIYSYDLSKDIQIPLKGSDRTDFVLSANRKYVLHRAKGYIKIFDVRNGFEKGCLLFSGYRNDYVILFEELIDGTDSGISTLVFNQSANIFKRQKGLFKSVLVD